MEFAVLQSLDELIGLALVMMLGAAAVAAVTQGLAVAVRARQRQLRRALEELLARVGMPAEEARDWAESAMRHPLVEGSVRCDEFIRALMELAGEGSGELARGLGVEGASEAAAILRQADRNALRMAEEAPGSTKEAALLERAMLAAIGENDAVARIHAEFGRTMERATARYRRETQWIAAGAAWAAVVAMRLDSLEVLARASRLQQAPPRYVGMGLAWMLLSLGAGFWYDRLKDLLHLRPGR